MLGAVIGDIVGSRFEFNNYCAKDFELFHPDCFVTDDSLVNNPRLKRRGLESL